MLLASAGADRRPIVEFAIENAQTVKKRRELQERQKRKGSAWALLLHSIGSLMQC